MVKFITYSNERYEKTKKFCLTTAKYIAGFDSVKGYDRTDIDSDFLEVNKEILSIPRGDGLWLWKPYFLLKALQESDESDIIFYCDAGSFFIKPPKEIIDLISSGVGIWVSNIGLIEKQFTKQDCFYLMDCSDEIYYKSNQIQANFIGIRKNDETLDFVRQWLNYCCDIRILSPEIISPGMENDSEFIEHRMDQSVLSLLCKKNGIEPCLDPTQYGRLPNKYRAEKRAFRIPQHKENYPTCIVLHRTPDMGFKTCFKQTLLAVLPIRVAKLLIKS